MPASTFMRREIFLGSVRAVNRVVKLSSSVGTFLVNCSFGIKTVRSINCGIFPILLARCLHHGVRITRRWTREDLDEQRDLITLELLEGKLLSLTA